MMSASFRSKKSKDDFKDKELNITVDDFIWLSTNPDYAGELDSTKDAPFQKLNIDLNGLRIFDLGKNIQILENIKIKIKEKSDAFLNSSIGFFPLPVELYKNGILYLVNELNSMDARIDAIRDGRNISLVGDIYVLVNKKKRAIQKVHQAIRDAKIKQDSLKN
ncbi:MAG: hypothetical protein OXU73_01275 [Candidatus Campbellbacteria bacterium]|nr:hypothetical protein [Candidatus Campbellbacteria bacterium]